VGSVALAGTQRTQAAGPAYLVQDIQPPNAPLRPNLLIDVNGTLFFIANDDLTGYELWKSDGTAQGTMLVKDIAIGRDSSFPSFLTNLNGVLIFVADNIGQGRELWRSDGTAGGSVLLKDMWPTGVDLSSDSFNLAAIDGRIYFSADDGVHGREV
jgi:ELWxxDGT repeat protein